MIMVPDEEYVQMMRLYSGGDPIRTEKAETDMRIDRVLKDRQLAPLEKGAKYQTLARKRKKLNKMIEEKNKSLLSDRPIFDSITSQPSISPPSSSKHPPTTGITPSEVPQTQLQTLQNDDGKDVGTDMNESFAEQGGDESTKKSKPSAQAKKADEEKSEFIKQYHGLFKHFDNKRGNMEEDILSAIPEHAKELVLTKEGRVLSNKQVGESSAMKNSDYRRVIAFLQGKEEMDPNDYKMYKVFIRRLMQNFKTPMLEAFENSKKTRSERDQEGGGSFTPQIKRKYKRNKYVIDLKNQPITNTKSIKALNIEAKKTPGLQRVSHTHRKTFKPQLWTKLGV